MMEKFPSNLQAIGAAAVVEFAKRWDGELAVLAGKVQCQCEPRRTSVEETDHGPDCSVAILRQAGRLMLEEAMYGLERSGNAEGPQ